MYRSNQSFNIPPGNPPSIWLFWKLFFKFLPTRAKMPFTRVHSGDQMPPPRGHFTGTKMTEGRRKCLRIQLSSKVFTTNKSLVQTAEVAATRSLNAQLFFVMQHTKRSIKKIPPIEITTSWPFHWHASSLPLLINILAVGQSSWAELFILFYFINFYVVVLNRRYRYCISL